MGGVLTPLREDLCATAYADIDGYLAELLPSPVDEFEPTRKLAPGAEANCVLTTGVSIDLAVTWINPLADDTTGSREPAKAGTEARLKFIP